MIVYIDDKDGSAGDLMDAIDFYIDRKADSGQEERLRKIYSSIKELKRGEDNESNV